jgi:hypothetical protein
MIGGLEKYKEKSPEAGGLTKFKIPKRECRYGARGANNTTPGGASLANRQR